MYYRSWCLRRQLTKWHNEMPICGSGLRVDCGLDGDTVGGRGSKVSLAGHRHTRAGRRGGMHAGGAAGESRQPSGCRRSSCPSIYSASMRPEGIASRAGLRRGRDDRSRRPVAPSAVNRSRHLRTVFASTPLTAATAVAVQPSAGSTMSIRLCGVVRAFWCTSIRGPGRGLQASQPSFHPKSRTDNLLRNDI